MQKWRRVIVFDVLMVILIIVLYSPVQIGLNPFDPNIIKAALSVIFAVLIAYELIKVNRDAVLTARAEKRINSGESNISIDEIKRMLQSFQKTSVVGTFAQHGLKQLEAIERKRATLLDTIGLKFQEGSLTWQKFADVVEIASQTITQNTSLLARRIQDFDVEDYNRNARNTISGLFNRTTLPENVRKEKRQLYEAALNEMRGIVAANERILVELDKFSLEMSQLETNASAEVNNRLLAEVNQIIDETKFYSVNL